MTYVMQPGPRGPLSPSPVQPIDADALMNILIEMIGAQASLGHAIEQLADGLARSGDGESISAATKAVRELGEVQRRMTAALEQMKVLRQSIR